MLLNLGGVRDEAGSGALEGGRVAEGGKERNQKIENSFGLNIVSLMRIAIKVKKSHLQRPGGDQGSDRAREKTQVFRQTLSSRGRGELAGGSRRDIGGRGGETRRA